MDECEVEVVRVQLRQHLLQPRPAVKEARAPSHHRMGGDLGGEENVLSGQMVLG